MNSKDYVLKSIAEMKTQGIPLSKVAWEAAKECIGFAYVYGARGQDCTPSYRQQAYNSHGTSHPTIKSACQVIRDNNPKDSCSGCKWYPSGKRTAVYDCRGFTYWILLKVYGWELMGQGATAQWDNANNWKSKGSVADGIPQDVIVCLFYRDKNKPSVMAHTGFYYNGETCECSSGVQYSKTLNKKWEYWGVPACVEGDTPTPPGPEPVTKPTLRRGSKGEWVVYLQTQLVNRGYSVGTSGVDGIFGRGTEAGVKAFQTDNGLVSDGVVGQKTWEAIDNVEPVQLYTVHIPGLPLYKADALIASYDGAYMTKE